VPVPDQLEFAESVFEEGGSVCDGAFVELEWGENEFGGAIWRCWRVFVVVFVGYYHFVVDSFLRSVFVIPGLSCYHRLLLVIVFLRFEF
jgi:hypothetical protein